MRIGDLLRVSLVFCVFAGLVGVPATLVCMRRPEVTDEGKSTLTSQSARHAETNREQLAQLRNSAVKHAEAEEWDAAVADISKDLELSPQGSERRCKALVLRAYCNCNQGRTDLALEDCSEALRICPDAATAYTGRAMVYLQLREFDKVIEEATRAIELDREDTSPYGMRAGAYLATKQYERAIPDITVLIAANPEVATLYRNRAKAFTETGRHEESIADYTKSISLEPGNAELYRERGRVHKKLSRDAAADDDDYIYAALRNKQSPRTGQARDVIQRASSQARLLDEEYYAHRDIKSWREASVAATRLIALSDETNEIRSYAYLLRANCHLSMRQQAEAMEDCSAAIKLTPDYGNAYAACAAIYYHIGEYARAIEQAIRAIELQGDEDYCRRLLVELYGATEDYDRASREITVLIALQPQEASFYAGRARAYMKLGRHHDALADCMKAISVAPDDPQPYLWRSEILAQLGQHEAAYKDRQSHVQMQNKRGLRISQRDSVPADESSAEKDAVNQKADDVVIPTLKFEEISLRSQLKW